MSFDPDSGLHLPASDDDLDLRRKLLADLGLDGIDAEFDAFAADLARAAGLPYAMVNMITTEQLFIGLHSPSDGDVPVVGRTMPLSHGFCPEVIDREHPLVLADVCAYPRFAGNPVVDQVGIRTYAGARLIDPGTGIVLGTVCVVGTTARSLSTAQDSLALIKDHRDKLMARIRQRAGHRPH